MAPATLLYWFVLSEEEKKGGRRKCPPWWPYGSIRGASLFISLCAIIAYCTTTTATAHRISSVNTAKQREKTQFAVLRVHVQDESQLQFLQSLYLNSSTFDFWKEPRALGQDVHVMVGGGELMDKFTAMFRRYNISWEVMIEDVRKLMEERMKESNHSRRISPRRLRDSPLTQAARARLGFSLARYHSFAEIINYLNSLAVNYPDRVQVQPLGLSHEGRQIPLIRIGSRAGGASKPAIWVDGGIHAREWVSPAAALYFIDQLVFEYDSDPQIRQLVDQLEWFVAPLLNPDGYEYSRSSLVDPEIRLWRKNRSPAACVQLSTGLFTPPQTRCCQGVDLNRNFDWFFGQMGSSSDPCSEIYSGSFAFSEPETRAVRDFITQHQGRIKAFVTMHSYSQILMYPFGHQLRTYPQDVDDLSTTAYHAAQALQSLYGTRYTVGTGADTLYPASGGSEDWAKGRMGVKYSYLFELRPEDSVYDGFLLSEHLIIPTSRETWEAVKVIATQSLRPNGGLGSLPNSVVPALNAVQPRQRLCRDTDPLCGYWAQAGACYALGWREQMQERCAQSCGFCGS